MYLREKVYRCPCAKCENTKFLSPEEVKVHLYKKGFTSGYWYWTSHGELQPPEGEEVNMHHSPPSISSENHAISNDAYHTMVEDTFNQHIPEPPNPDAQRFYDLLNALQRPL